MKLSVVMPIYNERATLAKVVDKVLAVPLDIELVCVDDGCAMARANCWLNCKRSIRKCACFCSLKIWVKARRCVAAFRKQLATTSLFRMPTWNMIPPSSPICSSL